MTETSATRDPAGKYTARRATAAERAVDGERLAAPWGRFRPGPARAALIGLARRTFLRRGMARYRLSALITGMGSPLDVDFRGCRFRIDGHHNLMDAAVMLNPAYNAAEIDFLLGALGPGGTAVDIGCNIGIYALPFARAVGAGGRVVAIDANPGMIARLTFNAAASDLAQVVPVAVAVGDTEGQVELSVVRDDLSIVAVEEVVGGTIPMRPLAAILEGCGVGRVDALKIDVEGFEDRALAPWLMAAPEAHLPARIVIERAAPDHDYPGCATAFAARGYRLAGRTRNNSLYERQQNAKDAG